MVNKDSRLIDWKVQPKIPQDTRNDLSQYPDLIAQLLYNRGIRNYSQAKDFLSENPISHDPFLMPGMKDAIERIRKAIDDKEHVSIYGDFDVDGISGTALLSHALGKVGAKITPYIPDRTKDGHGISLRALDHLKSEGVTLLVTVDCGISSRIEIEQALGKGIDTVITDHHIPPKELPRAYAIVDHQISGSLYPFQNLTGSGTALKVAQALYDSLGKTLPSGLISLASLGTVADVAPLINENRSIVKLGLEEICHAPSPGLSALVRMANLNNHVDSTDIGWSLSPRLNAPGRMDTGMISYELLVEQSEDRALTLAKQLNEWNIKRQSATKEASNRAKGLLRDPESYLLMVEDEAFLPGVIGLVAGRLANEFHRPSIVISTGPDVSRGSCRSIPEFDIAGALSEAASRGFPFLAHGGHKQAAGFTAPTKNIPDLKNMLVEIAEEKLTGYKLSPQQNIDAVIPLTSLSGSTYQTIQDLEPFGEGNPKPIFLSYGIQVVEIRTMGKQGEHLRLKLKDKGVIWDAIAFNQTPPQSLQNGKVDIIYTIGENKRYQEKTLQLSILGFSNPN